MICKDCIHYEACSGYLPSDLDKDVLDLCAQGKSDEILDINERCDQFKDKSKIIELPCSIGDPYFTAERFCTEGGYHEEKEQVDLIDCAYCCEKCDKELRVVEHEFYSAIQILYRKEDIGKTIFLTREEAVNKLEELK